MGILSQRRLFLGFSLSLGLDALPLRQLVLLSGSRLGLAARRRLDGTGKQFVRSPHGRANSLATNRPRPPVRPPTATESSLVPVNLKSVPASSLGPNDTFVFRNNSAGLGVPRGSLGKLNSFSSQTAQHGMATTNVYYGGAQRGEAEEGCKIAATSGQAMSAGPVRCSPSNRSHSYSGGSMQSASPGAGACSLFHAVRRCAAAGLVAAENASIGLDLPAD